MSPEGRVYGPFPVAATAAAVADFVAATGDDPGRWSGHAPPAFASVALFAVAPVFLADPGMAVAGGALLHSEQTFRWHGPLAVGESAAVRGGVTSIRERGPLRLVGLEVEAETTAGRWFEGRSTLVMSSAVAGAVAEEAEPGTEESAANDPLGPVPITPGGGPVPPLRRSASRADLVRYAGATRDWNPIHWDHDAARAAGFGGIVVHGLLMVAWLAQTAARHSPGPHPLHSLRTRFRGPLRPGVQAVVAGEAGTADHDGVPLDLRLSAGGDPLVTATVIVTP